MVGPLISPVSNGASNSVRVQDSGPKRTWRGRGKEGTEWKGGREEKRKENKNKGKTSSSSRAILRHLEAFPQSLLPRQRLNPWQTETGF